MDTGSRPAAIVAAFEPFGGRRRNRSWEAVRRAALASDVERVQLPVDFERLRARVPALVARGSRALLLVGEHGGARAIAVERLALNVVCARIPDNSGRRPQDVEIVPGAPLARAVTCDALAIVSALRALGLDAEQSHHAGTYACNAALYLALDEAERRGAETVIGFLHVPRRGWPRGPTTAALARAVATAVEAMRVAARSVGARSGTSLG